MTSFLATSWRRIRRLLHASSGAAAGTGGTPAVLGGLEAVAALEACASEAGALGAGEPAAAGARAFAHRREDACNRFGLSLAGIEAGGPRGAVAAALGLSLSGERAVAFLSGPDAVAAHDLLARAAGLHLPLVVHLACRAPAAHLSATGTGHEAYHAVADAGFFQLFAVNAQEAADLALIARRVAERALVPGLVAMDGEQTALAAQDLLLPGEALIGDYLGSPARPLNAPTDAQRAIFGATRRLVPRWYDLDRPLLLGAAAGAESWGLGAAGDGPYFAGHVERILADACIDYERLTGRGYGPLLEHEVDGARTVLVAQGSAVETAIAVAREARGHVGVIGLRGLRPFPAERLASRLQRAKVVAVLERAGSPLAGDGPLLREVRGALAAAGAGAGPRIVGVPYGLGGLPLRAADLLALVRELREPRRSPVYLGIEFARGASAYPKRQAQMDALRRADPALAELGLRSAEPTPDLRPAGSITVAVDRLAGAAHATLAGAAATLLHEVAGGHLRSRPGSGAGHAAAPSRDLLVHAPEPLLDVGDDVPVDIAVIAAPRIVPGLDPTVRLVEEGSILLVAGHDDEALLADLPPGLVETARRRRLALHAVAPPPGGETPAGSVLHDEALLGAVFALIAARREAGAPSAKKLRAARETMLEDLADDERSRRLEAFAIGFETVRRVELPAPTSTSVGATTARGPAPDDALPPVLRRRGRAEPTIDSIAHFWDQVGVLYRTGDLDELSADPLLASGAIPPLTAGFRGAGADLDVLPVFDPRTCDGHGSAWTTCPDGSIRPVALTPRALLDAGIEIAGEAGHPASALRAVAGKLAKRMQKLVAGSPALPATLGALLRTAFDEITAKTAGGDGGDRIAAQEEALRAVIDEVGPLPIARTAIFFDEPEAEAAGTGALLTLLVDPDACRSASIVLTGGDGHGLRAAPRTDAVVAMARRLWALGDRLPGTSPDLIARVHGHPDVGPLAAIMMERHPETVPAGGAGAVGGAGARLALRRTLAVAGARLAPRRAEQRARLATLRERLAGRIREQLADALPTDDLDALAEGLDALGRKDVDLAALSGKVDEAVTGGHVDGDRLGRLVDAARGLADLEWRIARGIGGDGRAALGVVLTSGPAADCAGAYPDNPFPGPAALDIGGATAHFARGAIEGTLRQTVAGARLARWAELELEAPGEAARAALALTGLRFEDLADDERRQCPPLLVVADAASLGGDGLAELTWLLEQPLPIKVLMMNDIGGGGDPDPGGGGSPRAPARSRLDAGLLALLGRRAFVVQTSLADEAHFAAGVGAALDFDGPALIHVHAPSPERHGFPPEAMLVQARLAVTSRAFPLFRFAPTAAGGLGAGLDLSGNPEPAARHVTDESGRAITPVDWALTEGRFAERFTPLGGDDPAPTPIGAYLGLAPAERAGAIAGVTRTDGEAERQLRVAAPLVADAEARLRLWRTLQEIAGIVVAPGEEGGAPETAEAIAARHASEISRLRQEHEAQLVEMKAEYEAEATDRVTRGLMALAGYEPGAGGGAGSNGDGAP